MIPVPANGRVELVEPRSARPRRIADLRYDMRAGDLAPERVPIVHLQRRRALAVRRGDFRFARAYGLLVDARIKEAQEQA